MHPVIQYIIFVVYVRCSTNVDDTEPLNDDLP